MDPREPQEGDPATASTLKVGSPHHLGFSPAAPQRPKGTQGLCGSTLPWGILAPGLCTVPTALAYSPVLGRVSGDQQRTAPGPRDLGSPCKASNLIMKNITVPQHLGGSDRRILAYSRLAQAAMQDPVSENKSEINKNLCASPTPAKQEALAGRDTPDTPNTLCSQT